MSVSPNSDAESDRINSDMSGKEDLRDPEEPPLSVFSAPRFSQHWGELEEHLSGPAIEALRAHLRATQEAAVPNSARSHTELSELSSPEETPPDVKAVKEAGGGIPVAKSNTDFGRQEYWDSRFLEEEHYDWLLTFQQVAPQLLPLLQPYSQNARILIVGCGNSAFSADLYDAGYHNIVNVDYSGVVISRMREQHGLLRPLMTWLEMDMTKMTFPVREDGDAPFDVVIDKAALDAIMVDEKSVWDPAEDVVLAADATCRGVRQLIRGGRTALRATTAAATAAAASDRPLSIEALAAAAAALPSELALSPDQISPLPGLYVMISFMQPHFRTKYLFGTHADRMEGLREEVHSAVSPAAAALGYSPRYDWRLRYETIRLADGGSFEHFLYIMYAGQAD
jgi:hypothetical protein